MEMLNYRIHRRALGGITVGAAATAGLARLVSAQDATPEADEEVVDASPEVAPTLAELEAARQVGVVVNNNSYAVYLGDYNLPGWFVFNVENGSESDASFNLARLPEGVAVGDFTSALFQLSSGNFDALPDWFADVEYAGGTYAPVDGANSVLVNLGVGEWVIFSNLAVSTQSVTTFQVLEPEAEEGEEAAATPEVAEPTFVTAPEGFGSTFTVSVADGAINADSSPGAGYNVIGVRNDASTAANFVLIHSEETVDDAAAADLASAFLAGEETDAHLVGGMGIISTNTFGYIELESEGVGSYIGFSSVANATGGLQLEDGALIVFNV